MTDRERFIKTLNYEPVDQRPLVLVGPWPDTVERWHGEGLPRGADVNEFLGVSPIKLNNLIFNSGIDPWFEERTIEEDETHRVFIDQYGRTVRDFKDHTSMPEWIDFPIKSPEDFRRVLDEHCRIDDIDSRFPPNWEETVRKAALTDAVIMIDGGCYYWTLRSLAGVEMASYLFYDAPGLVDELFERINIVALEGIRRATKLVKVDVVGFGEDIGFKTGPLISPEMFRRFIKPRYKKSMDLAHSRGIEFTWYDSDGDLRQLIPDYLEVGINMVTPCEVAAGMSCPELRREFGRELRLMGGIDKREIAKGRKAIDAEIQRNKPLIDDGGYLPAIDHSVSSDVSFDDYRYFVDAIRKAVQ